LDVLWVTCYARCQPGSFGLLSCAWLGLEPRRKLQPSPRALVLLRRGRNENEGVISCRRGLFFNRRIRSKPPPKVGNRPVAQAKLRTPMGCKLVGTVKGTKLWAGDCTDAAELRGAAPTAETTPPSLPAQAAGAIPPGQKQ
jgi:hypothetical protein